MSKKSNTDNFSKCFNSLTGAIQVTIAIGAIGFSIGFYSKYVTHQNEIMTLNQNHNTEITNMKLDFNRELLRLENENQILKLYKEKDVENGK